jgi:hypothetical protein
MQKLKTHAKEMEEDTKNRIEKKNKIKKGSLFFSLCFYELVSTIVSLVRE